MNEEIAIQQLKEDVLRKMRHTLDSPTDFDYLALQIKNVTGEDISSSTLKRFFGYIPANSTIRKSSLSIITRYLGYTGWSDYEFNTHVTSGFISTKTIMSDKLHEGDLVEVEWNPDRRIIFSALKDNKFVVMKSINSHLQKGDTMEIMIFILNQPLQVKNVVHEGKNLSHYTAGIDGGLTKLLLSK